LQVYKNETIRDQQNLALVPCHVCGGAEYAFFGFDNGFRVVKCVQADCGFVFVNPRPTKQQLNNFYDNFYPMENDTAVAWTKEMVQINREVAHILKNFRVTGHVLDIGSSFEQFLAEVEKIGSEGTGIEPSLSAVSYAQAHTKSRIIQGFIEDNELEPNSFHAIVSLFLLEHVLEPYKFMERVYRMLKSGRHCGYKRSSYRAINDLKPVTWSPIASCAHAFK
jgi:SAM-dependent methyltransferase